MNRRGGAILLALLALLLLGGLASLALAASRVRAQSGARILAHARARAAALSGLAEGEARWDGGLARGLAVGAASPLSFGTPTPRDGISRADSLYRLGAYLYLLRSVGEQRTGDGHLLAREGVGRILRVEAPGIPDSAALFTSGAALLLADSSVGGDDQVPSGWSGPCGPLDSARAAVIHGAVPPTLGCGTGLCAVGNPALGRDSSLVPGFLDRLPVAGLSQLLGRTDHRVLVSSLTPSPATQGGRCDASRADNWGDPAAPASPCGGYFPLIGVAAPFTMAGGSGQGVLLATGDLTLALDARFAGVILAAGHVHLRDQVRVEGTILAEGGVTIEGMARLQRSRCAVSRALRGVARPLRPVPRGFWRWP